MTSVIVYPTTKPCAGWNRDDDFERDFPEAANSYEAFLEKHGEVCVTCFWGEGDMRLFKCTSAYGWTDPETEKALAVAEARLPIDWE